MWAIIFRKIRLAKTKGIYFLREFCFTSAIWPSAKKRVEETCHESWQESRRPLLKLLGFEAVLRGVISAKGETNKNKRETMSKRGKRRKKIWVICESDGKPILTRHISLVSSWCASPKPSPAGAHKRWLRKEEGEYVTECCGWPPCFIIQGSAMKWCHLLFFSAINISKPYFR